MSSVETQVSYLSHNIRDWRSRDSRHWSSEDCLPLEGQVDQDLSQRHLG
jgi:hypothetical protein